MHGVILDSKTIGKDVDLDPITSLLDSWDVFDLTDSSETNQRIFDADVVLTNKVKIDKSNLEAAKKLKKRSRAVCRSATSEGGALPLLLNTLWHFYYP